ncbi:MAG: SiaB family protein kinase [Treponema sp.]|nr:SiaB family protein kinase [Treponema sp.]MCL2250790.1 SiaB family protein kinase [Treponema sp.]
MIMEMINWHKTLNEKKIILIYSGPLWSQWIGEIAGTLKKHLEIDNIPINTSQEVFSVFIEQMNNMLMYSAEKIKFEVSPDKQEVYESPKGMFVLGKEGNSYFIQTCNVMKKENSLLIKNRIDYLNTLDKQELRKFYKKQMKTDDDNPESKGAGLGFIEIARRISSKIEYSFSDYDEGLTFFTLHVTIGGIKE